MDRRNFLQKVGAFVTVPSAIDLATKFREGSATELDFVELEVVEPASVVSVGRVLKTGLNFEERSFSLSNPSTFDYKEHWNNGWWWYAENDGATVLCVSLVPTNFSAHTIVNYSVRDHIDDERGIVLREQKYSWYEIYEGGYDEFFDHLRHEELRFHSNYLEGYFT